MECVKRETRGDHVGQRLSSQDHAQAANLAGSPGFQMVSEEQQIFLRDLSATCF
jgi:hypothetical protein